LGKVIVFDQTGVRHEVTGKDGWKVMEIIRDSGLPIKADCGGNAICATCHVYVDPPWAEKLDAPLDDETDRLEEDAVQRTERSRLSCQIEMRPDLDGLVVTLAPGSEP
jgi:2Fe-2S ferredoxin